MKAKKGNIKMLKSLWGSPKFPLFRQLESSDCGPACLKMIFGYYNKRASLEYLREVCLTNRLGTSIYSIIKGATAGDLEAAAVNINIESITAYKLFPCILLVNNDHFVILYDHIIRENNFFNRILNRRSYFKIADPAFGRVDLTREELIAKWVNGGKSTAIIFEPGNEFNCEDLDFGDEYIRENRNRHRKELIALIKDNRKGLLMIVCGMILSSFTYLSFPILTQRIVDVGIKYKSTEYIELILITQVVLFISILIADGIKSLLLLLIGAKIEFGLTYNFLSKLMRLPLYFFEARVAGDLMQRISDNNRIQFFIKNYLLDFLISISTVLTLMVLMIKYNVLVFAAYTLGTILGITFSLLFIRKRELLDYRRFDANSQNADNLLETIVSMSEIKLNSAEKVKIEKWKDIQFKLLNVNSKILKLQQLQLSGSAAISQLKNISITFITAILVIQDKISIGEMVSISFMIGQLNLPISQIIQFFQYQQDAKNSFARLSEIQKKKEEDHGIKDSELWTDAKIDYLFNSFKSIKIDNLKFSYSEDEEDLLFDNLCLDIEKGKVTAVVGASGSGKTTLLKMILKFYTPMHGRIHMDDIDVKDIPAGAWRKNFGVVMQDGYVFSDSITFNITLSTDPPDLKKLENAVKIACADEFIAKLPQKFDTKIGNSGIGLSTGQKQRILIARAVYRDPQILFFDEATSALDANNEKKIQENLNLFFQGKTVLIIAHRLSTVKKADKILVFEGGVIVESGTHDTLITTKGEYYTLVQNQLEL